MAVVTPSTSPGSPSVLVQLNPSRIQTQAGDPPVYAVVRIQNLTNTLEQYTTEVTGLDPTWYTTPLTSIGLFPRDQEDVQVSFHPPKQPGLHVGAYPFQIRVRSRGGILVDSVSGVLDVRGNAVYRMDLVPRRQTGRPWRSGRYRVRLTNTGADVRLKLEARDPDQFCRFRISNDEPALVSGGSTTDIGLSVQAHAGWFGAERSYDFLVTARPLDARGDPQVVPGQYVFHPLWQTWWQPLKFFLVCLLLLGVVSLLVVTFAQSWPQHTWAQIQSGYGPTLESFCRNIAPRLLCPANDTDPIPQTDPACTFRDGFFEVELAYADLIGQCRTNEAYDMFGNSHQLTEEGELIWVKGSNSIYFVSNTDYKLRRFNNGTANVLDDPSGVPSPTAPTPTPQPPLLATPTPQASQ